MAQRFSKQVEAILLRGGWFEGRTYALRNYNAFPSKPFPAARRVLGEFGGLQFGESGAGIDFATCDFDMRPVWGDRRFKGWRKEESSIGRRLYKLGMVSRLNAYLLIDDAGAVYSLMDDLILIAPSFEEALESLLLGRRHPAFRCLESEEQGP